MRKYPLLLLLAVLPLALVGCDSSDPEPEPVQVQFVVEGYGEYAAPAVDRIVFSVNGAPTTRTNQSLPFTQSVSAAAGATVSLEAEVEAPPNQIGFRIAIYANGTLVDESAADGFPSSVGEATQSLSLTRTLN